MKYITNKHIIQRLTLIGLLYKTNIFYVQSHNTFRATQESEHCTVHIITNIPDTQDKTSIHYTHYTSHLRSWDYPFEKSYQRRDWRSIYIWGGGPPRVPGLSSQGSSHIICSHSASNNPGGTFSRKKILSCGTVFNECLVWRDWLIPDVKNTIFNFPPPLSHSKSLIRLSVLQIYVIFANCND